MPEKEYLFEEMDDIPTRKVTIEEAKVELTIRARSARIALEALKKANWVSQDTLDRVIDL